MNNLRFFPRLLLAFLMVVVMAGLAFYLVGSALAPSLLENHLESHGVSNHDTEEVSDTLVELEVSYRQALAQSLLGGVIAALGIGGILSFFIATQVAKPISNMSQASHRIAAGNYSERVTSAAPAEMSELAQDFNAMAEALEFSEAQRSELIRNLAHEFRTPLMNLRGYIEAVEDGVFELDDETLSATKRQLTRLERLMTDLALLSRVDAKQESIQPERINLSELCKETSSAMQKRFLEKQVSLTYTSKPALFALADPIRVEQILSNLLANALRHCGSSDRVEVWLEQEKDKIMIHVKDTGEGIPEDALPFIFERFYRVKHDPASSSGSGIGLSIARYFVEAQGGELFVESELGRGTHFWFSLPVAN